jgi:hypothetical protein
MEKDLRELVKLVDGSSDRTAKFLEIAKELTDVELREFWNLCFPELKDD